MEAPHLQDSLLRAHVDTFVSGRFIVVDALRESGNMRLL